MTPPKIKPVQIVVGLGAAVGIVTAVQAPAYASGSLAFIGGLFGGAAMVSNTEREKVQSRERATRVASCFSTLYEKNNGVIDPVELSFLSNIPVQESHDFLSTIAEANGGQKISVKDGVGVLFSYPHTTNALDTLSKNAAAWAEAQTQQLQGELQQHKQAIQLMQAQQAAAKLQQNSSPWDSSEQL